MAKAEYLKTKLWKSIILFFEKYDYLIMPVTSVPPFSVEKEYPDKVNGVKLNTYLDWDVALLYHICNWIAFYFYTIRVY